MRPRIRAFIAIDLDERLKRELARIQEKLKESNADVKWVEPANLHLTLRFLGDIQPEILDDIEAAMARTANQFSSFHLDVGTLSAFPNTETPKIIWAGITKRANLLADIASSLRQELNGIEGLDEAPEFEPHITLGRARSVDGLKRLSELLKSPKIPSGLTHKAERLTLFRSELMPKGPAYHVLHSVALK